MGSSVLLKMENISKNFPGVKALDNVQLTLNSSEVLALLGENGAGKSTLMKILAGVFKPDNGSIAINGEQVIFNNTKDSQNSGISIIYQEFNLIPYLSIGENIFLGREPRNSLGIIDWKKLYSQTSSLLNRVGLKDLSPKTIISDLTVAEMQLVEIAKALSFTSKILIMDEPTAALTDKDTERLFNIIKGLKKDGIGIIYITHRLEELDEIADRIVVLRDGKYIGESNIKDISKDYIVKMMVGRDINDVYPTRNYQQQEKVLEVTSLSLENKLFDINFNLHKGEILGIAGLLGSGRTELSKALFGFYKEKKGKVKIGNHEIVTIKNAIDAGIVLVTDDRKREGLVLGMSVYENLLLPSSRKISKKGILYKNTQDSIVNKWIEELKIKVSTPKTEVNSLSGGNQQKVVLGKWLEMKPKVIILNEPTRGIDVGSKQEIYQLINRLAEEGISIILISSEMPELLGLSDRILVMKNGRIVKEFEKGEASQEKIFIYASGGDEG